MEDNDAQLQLKKRARRRLVGAVFFVSVVALVLPMLMDHDPRPPLQDVEIRIPGQDEKPFNPAMVAVPQESEPAPATQSQPAEAAVTPPARTADPVPASAVEAKPLDVAPAARVVETVRTQPVLGADGKPKKLPDAPPADKPATAKPADNKATKSTEKPSEKPTKPTPEKKPEPAAKPQPEKKPEPAKAAADDEAKRAAAILAGKPVNASASAAGGAHLILIGAFTNEANVVNLRKKLGELGIKTYTEPLDSPQGKKIRVRAGPFPNREAADKALAKMQKIGVSGVVAPKP